MNNTWLDKKVINNKKGNSYANEINSSNLCSIFKPSLSFTRLSLCPKYIALRHGMAKVYIFSRKRLPFVVIYVYGIK